MEQHFELPMPPSVNRYYRSVNKGQLAGRVMISEEGRKYRGLVKQAILLQRLKFVTGRISLSVTLHFNDNRNTDLDNRIKPLQDALQKAGLFCDDSQIDRLSITRGEVINGGKCLVVIRGDL